MQYLNDLRQSNLPFSIAQIIPGTVIGPSEFATTSEEALANMDRQTKALLFDEMTPRYAFGFVHVKDCARVHIEALDQVKARSDALPPWFVAAATVNEGCNGTKLWTGVTDMLEAKFGKEIEAGIFKIGRGRVPINMPFRVDATLTEATLLDGDKIRGLSGIVEEVARWYINLKNKEI